MNETPSGATMLRVAMESENRRLTVVTEKL